MSKLEWSWIIFHFQISRKMLSSGHSVHHERTKTTRWWVVSVSVFIVMCVYVCIGCMRTLMWNYFAERLHYRSGQKTLENKCVYIRNGHGGQRKALRIAANASVVLRIRSSVFWSILHVWVFKPTKTNIAVM